MTNEPIEDTPSVLEDDIAEAEIVEATGLDINPTDKVFWALGEMVKVRVVAVPEMPFGMAAFEVSGSYVDEQGHARVDEGQFLIAPAVRLTVQSDRATDVAAQLDIMRKECVRSVLRAIVVLNAVKSIPV